MAMPNKYDSLNNVKGAHSGHAIASKLHNQNPYKDSDEIGRQE